MDNSIIFTAYNLTLKVLIKVDVDLMVDYPLIIYS